MTVFVFAWKEKNTPLLEVNTEIRVNSKIFMPENVFSEHKDCCNDYCFTCNKWAHDNVKLWSSSSKSSISELKRLQKFIFS